MDISNYNLKPCPFCGSNKLDISSKRVQTYDYTNYRTCVYCKDCYGYGPRVLVKHVEPDKPYYLRSMNIDFNEVAKEEAVKAWNDRSE